VDRIRTALGNPHRLVSLLALCGTVAPVLLILSAPQPANLSEGFNTCGSHNNVPPWFNYLSLLWQLPYLYFHFVGFLGDPGPAWLAWICLSAFMLIKWSGLESINLDTCPIYHQKAARAGQWITTITICLWHGFLHRRNNPAAR
jgi:hypothetical protein